MEGFKAIVIVGRPGQNWQHRQGRPCGPRAVAYTFRAFSSALAFMRGTKSQQVVVEFGVEVDTLDFYDAVKALNVPVIFSANSLEPSHLRDFDINVSNVVYADRRLESRPVSDSGTSRPVPGVEARLPTSA
jgi:hypothetical protein